MYNLICFFFVTFADPYATRGFAALQLVINEVFIETALQRFKFSGNVERVYFLIF